MAKNVKDFSSDAPNAEATSYNTVFVDTSLDTHLVFTISSSDTVYDFKEKMLHLHSQTFPQIDGVKIHSVKVKRLGHFYHLPDAMLVSSAFGRTKKAWLVFVEASSCSGEHGKELVLYGATLEKDFRVSPLSACSGDDDGSSFNKETTDFSRLGELPSMLKVEKKIDSSVDASGKVQSEIETRKFVGGNSTEVGIKVTDPLSSTVADLTLNDESMLSLDESQKNDTSVKEMVLSLNHDSQVQPSESSKPSHEIEAQEMIEGGADGTNKSVQFMGTSNPTEAVGSVGTKKKAPVCTEVGAKIAAPPSSTVADLALKDIRNDNIVNDQSMPSVDESQKNDVSQKKIVLSLPCNLTMPNAVVETGSSSGTIKRKKLKVKKSAAKLQDNSGIDVEMNNVNAERNQAQFDKLKDKHEPEGNKILDSAIETLNEKASGFAEMSLDPGIEAGKSGRSHKKKREKLHAAIDAESSPMEHSIPGVSQKRKRTKKHTNS